jgi:hypothetical protein
MPLVDVTDLLRDVDIAGQSFLVLRRQEIVDQYGESITTQQILPAIGSIQPAHEQGLLREEGYDAQARSISVITEFRLRGASKGPPGVTYKPDIIYTRSYFLNYYEVHDASSWGAFGAGFIKATANAIDWLDYSVRQQFLSSQ